MEAIFRAVRILDSSAIALAGEPPIPVTARCLVATGEAFPTAGRPACGGTRRHALHAMLCAAAWIAAPSGPANARLAEEDPEFAGSLSQANQSRDRWDPIGRSSRWIQVVRFMFRRDDGSARQCLASTWSPHAVGMAPRPGSRGELAGDRRLAPLSAGLLLRFRRNLGHEADEYDTVRIYFHVTADSRAAADQDADRRTQSSAVCRFG